MSIKEKHEDWYPSTSGTVITIIQALRSSSVCEILLDILNPEEDNSHPVNLPPYLSIISSFTGWRCARSHFLSVFSWGYEVFFTVSNRFHLVLKINDQTLETCLSYIILHSGHQGCIHFCQSSNISPKRKANTLFIIIIYYLYMMNCMFA